MIQTAADLVDAAVCFLCLQTENRHGEWDDYCSYVLIRIKRHSSQRELDLCLLLKDCTALWSIKATMSVDYYQSLLLLQ